MSAMKEQLEAALSFADKINAVVEKYDTLNTSIYEFLARRSSSKFGSIRGKEEIYKLFIELNKHEYISQRHFDFTVNRLMVLSDKPIGMLEGMRAPKKYGSNGLGRGHAQTLLAGLFGYGNYRDAEAAGKLNNNQIRNLRYGREALVVGQGMIEMRPAVQRAAAGKQPDKFDHINSKPVMRSKEGLRIGGILAKDMAWFVRDYGSQFRTAWLQGNRAELRHVAVKRFYGLESANDLAPYLKLRIFPPAFEPNRITVGEIQLAQHFAHTDRRDKKWTAMTAFLELRPWCATPEIEKELEKTIGTLSKGKPHRFAQIFRRKYGVVMLVLDHEAGIGLITEKGKITKITRLQPKPGKAPKRERSFRPAPKDVPVAEHDIEQQPPLHYQPNRIVLSSHDPALQHAFRELHKLSR